MSKLVNNERSEKWQAPQFPHHGVIYDRKSDFILRSTTQDVVFIKDKPLTISGNNSVIWLNTIQGNFVYFLVPFEVCRALTSRALIVAAI